MPSGAIVKPAVIYHEPFFGARRRLSAAPTASPGSVPRLTSDACPETGNAGSPCGHHERPRGAGRLGHVPKPKPQAAVVRDWSTGFSARGERPVRRPRLHHEQTGVSRAFPVAGLSATPQPACCPSFRRGSLREPCGRIHGGAGTASSAVNVRMGSTAPIPLPGSRRRRKCCHAKLKRLLSF